MRRADIASPNSRAPLGIEGLSRSKQELMQVVALRRGEELTAAHRDAMHLARLAHETGERSLRQVGIETFHAGPAPVAASANAPRQEQSYIDSIDSVAASNEAARLARPSGEVDFNQIIGNEFGAAAVPADPAQYVESNDGTAPEYRPNLPNGAPTMRAPNNPAEYEAAYATLEQIHGPLRPPQPPIVDQQPGIPLDQLGRSERELFEKWDADLSNEGSVNV